MGQARRLSPSFRRGSNGAAAPRSPWTRWRPLFSLRFSDWLFACRNWARAPCTPMRPSMPTSSDNCWPAETFTYDPQDRHGPALAALALPLARMQGAKSFSDLTESELRLTSVLAGTDHNSALRRCSRDLRLSRLPHCGAAVCLRFRCPSTTTGTSSMNRFLRCHVRTDPVGLAARARDAPRGRPCWPAPAPR